MKNQVELIKNLIEKDDIKEAFDVLNRLLISEENTKFSNDLTLLRSKIKQLEREKRNETISYSEYNIYKAKIVLSSLELLNEIELEGLQYEENNFDKKNKATKVFSKNKIVFSEVDNKGSITINYDKRTVWKILTVIVLLIAFVVIIWPDIPVESVDYNHQSAVDNELDGVYDFSHSIGEDVYVAIVPRIVIDKSQNSISLFLENDENKSIGFPSNYTVKDQQILFTNKDFGDQVVKIIDENTLRYKFDNLPEGVYKKKEPK